MRVLFDDHIFAIQHHGGISRVFAEIAAELARRPDVEVVLPFSRSINVHLLDKAELGVSGFLGERHFPGKRSLLRVANRPRVWATVRYGRYDVFHPTFYDLKLAKASRGQPMVVTVHDMTPELMPETFARPEEIHPDKRELCQMASAVIAVSETTKADLVRLFGIDPARVTVIHSGVSDTAMWRPGGPPPTLPSRYLLVVGRRDGYKNFGGIVGPLARILRRFTDRHVVCVGGGPLTTEEQAPFADTADRVHQFTLNDSELAYAYAHAEAFLFPSLYEGFGLPILESFVNGCPAVLAERSCFPEIAGDAALYFDPDHPETLVTALTGLLNNDALRARLIADGRDRTKAFTWAAAADRLMDVYKTVIARTRSLT